MKYHDRAIAQRIRNALKISPVVFINGPRQAGKSTLVKAIAKEYAKMDYVTFDDITIRANALNDPQGFLRSFSNPVIIDEVQKVPEIFEGLKLLVDEYRLKDKISANGRFLLTGSVDAMVFPKLSEALVGRMIPISLYPLSTGEMFAGGKQVISGLFDQKIAFKDNGEDKKPTRIEAIDKATFPEIIDMSKDERHEWFNGYISTIFERDIRELAQIEKITALPSILKVLAARVGSLLKDSDLAKSTNLNPMTCKRYKVLFEKLFLIKQISPWYRSVGHSAVKAHKTFFVDTALLCHQLGVDLEELKQNNPILFGHVLENFIFSELQKQLGLLIGFKLYYFRTHNGKEVDFIIERQDGALIGIEVKSDNSVDNRYFHSLRILKDKVGKDFVRGIVLYCGKDTISFADDMIAMPISSLWKFNMEVEIENDVKKNNDSLECFIWARYGDNTRIRCDIKYETISDYFWNNPSFDNGEMEKAILKHMDLIKQIFIRKITNGEIYVINHDNGDGHVDGRYIKIMHTTLTPADFGYKDFRKK